MISDPDDRPVPLFWCPECRQYFEGTHPLIHEILTHAKAS